MGKIDLKPNVAKSQANNSLSAMLGGGDAATGTRIAEMPITQLVPYSAEDLGFASQPFRMYTDEKMNELTEDVRENGILSPIIVRPHKGKYQILSGHNRTKAAELAGLRTVPIIVRDVDDTQAAIIVANANLMQRDRILPSERAFAYKLRIDAIEKSGATNGRTTADISAETGENKRQIQRYVRLTQLNSDLLDMVDNDTIPVRAGVELSYTAESVQKDIVAIIRENPQVAITIALAEKIRKSFETKGDYQAIKDMIITPKPEKKAPKPKAEKPQTEQGTSIAAESDGERIVKIPFAKIEPYFDDKALSDEEITDVICAHFDYVHDKYGEQFMSIYRTSKMAQEM